MKTQHWQVKQPACNWNRLLRIGCGCVLLTALVLGGLLPKRAQPVRTEIILANPEAREAFLLRYGWVGALSYVTETRMPMEWQTAIGQRWVALQTAQGLCPTEYAGEAIVRYCYRLEVDWAGDWYAELWLCGDALVGAQVYDRSDPQSMQGVRTVHH